MNIFILRSRYIKTLLLALWFAYAAPVSAIVSGFDSPTDPASPIQSITVSPTETFLNYDTTVELTVTAYYRDGTSFNVDPSHVTFSVDDESVAQVLTHNIVEAIGIGNAVVTAEYAGRTAQVTIHGIGKTPVLQTGQKSCYDEYGNLYDTCDTTGQDGEFQSGKSIQNRYSVSGDCITDSVTGLMWAKPSMLTQFLSWHDAKNTIALMSPCGFVNWRLPNLNELRSLVHYNKENPAVFLENQGFTSASTSAWVWTSTLDLGEAPSEQFFYLIDMSTGRIFSAWATDWPVSVYSAWLVREVSPGSSTLPQTGQSHCSDGSGNFINCTEIEAAGQDGQVNAGVSWGQSRYVNSSSDPNCVTDTQTGLTWHGIPDIGTYTWLEALNNAEMASSTRLCGMDGWRLPSINELVSLMNQSFPYNDDAIATYPEDTSDYLYEYLNRNTNFSGLSSDTFWSSTTNASDPSNVWTFDMSGGGDIYSDSKLHHYHVILVRGRKHPE